MGNIERLKFARTSRGFNSSHGDRATQDWNETHHAVEFPVASLLVLQYLFSGFDLILHLDVKMLVN